MQNQQQPQPITYSMQDLVDAIKAQRGEAQDQAAIWQSAYNNLKTTTDARISDMEKEIEDLKLAAAAPIILHPVPEQGELMEVDERHDAVG